MSDTAPPSRNGPRPAHHRPGGGYTNPWKLPDEAERDRRGGFLQWRRDRLRQQLPPDPPVSAFPLVESAIAHPVAPADELRVTWVGQSTFLIQMSGVNLLTDPVWSRRASPVSFAGPARLVSPGIAFDKLPPIHAVLLSHDHYDHLDAPTIRRIHRVFGDSVRWFVPLGFAPWLERRGVRNIVERDWWQAAQLDTPGGALSVIALPARHWCARSPVVRTPRLWASWALRSADGRALYFAGDSGYCPAFEEIGRRYGPFDVTLVPIGAYEPRWFMAPAHMDPPEAVRAYVDLGAKGAFVPMHWGTFRLSDEDPLEPPRRTREAWRVAGLPEEELRILRHGETLVLTGAAR